MTQRKAARIFDIGFHKGEDTAVYLALGYQVVAVDAAPALACYGRRRFARAIARKKLVLLETGIGEAAGDRTFWISPTNSQWNSFRKDIAGRHAVPEQSVRVPMRPLGDLLAEYGPASYVKIDIEGYDLAALRSIPADLAPPFLSVEMTHDAKAAEEMLRELQRLGYARFLVVAQNDFSEVRPGQLQRYWSAPPAPSQPQGVRKFYRAALRRIGRAMARLAIRPPRLTWWHGSSGPFGPLLRGPWYEMATLNPILAELREADRRQDANGLGWWFDIHAAR